MHHPNYDQSYKYAICEWTQNDHLWHKNNIPSVCQYEIKLKAHICQEKVFWFIKSLHDYLANWLNAYFDSQKES